MKGGLTKLQSKDLVKEVCRTKGYCFCVGAGISNPAFPNWETLCRTMLDKAKSGIGENPIFVELGSKYSLDALIQASKNILNLPDEEFSKILSEALYGGIKSKLDAEDYKVFAEVMSAPNPGSVPPKNWAKFEIIVESHFASTSAYFLADFIVESISKGIHPDEIISFNAEPLLYQLINLKAWIKNKRSNAALKKIIDPITRSLSSRVKDRIAFHFCHGLLPIPEATIHRNEFSSVDKLVFSESDYLLVGANIFSWQSMVFTTASSQRRIFFIGLSLSDPNIRKWISWSIENRKKEIESIGGKFENATFHYWINANPRNEKLKQWYESSVSHLGVRLIWIDDWGELDSLLKAML